MEITDSERIKKVVEFIGLTANKLSKEICINGPHIFYDIKAGKCGISKTLSRKIVEKYPEFNMQWLLTGEGEMLHEAEVSGDRNAKNHYIGQTGIGKAADELTVEKLIEELRAQRESYERIIMALISEK